MHLSEADARGALADLVEQVLVDPHPQFPPVGARAVGGADQNGLVVGEEAVSGNRHEVRGVGDAEQPVVPPEEHAEVDGRVLVQGFLVAEGVVVDPDVVGVAPRD